MIKKEAFPEIRMKIDELLKITNSYCFDDLARAVYCINLCINNRSVLESCLALNACLIEYMPLGKERISNYKEFGEFFDKIFHTMKPRWADDYIVEDFGEVRIRYRENFFRVIVGTGHNNVFACLNFLPRLAAETAHEIDLYELLEYSSGVIDYFKDVNINDNAQEKRFVLPSKELFERVCSFFENECNRYNLEGIFRLFDDVENVIEKTHFVSYEGTVYPLYNVSILLDVYNIWESILNEEQRISVANHGIIQKIYDLFETDRSNICTMFSPAMIFVDQKYDDSQPVYTFIAKCSKGVIFAINEDEYENSDLLGDEIARIRRLQSNGKLHIAEIYNRFNNKQGLRGVLIPEDVPVEFLIYNSFTNPNQNYLTLGEVNCEYDRCTALDVIYYLDFMDNLDELFDYLSYNKKRDYESSFGFGTDAAHFFTWKSQGHYIAKGALVFSMVDVGYDTENVAVVNYFKDELCYYPFHDDDYIFREPFSWKIERRDSGEIEIFTKHGMGFGGVYIPLPKDNYIFLANNVEFYKNVPDLEKYRQLIQLLEEVISEGIESIQNIFYDCYFVKTGIQLTFMPIEYAVGAGHESFLREDRNYIYSDAQYHSGKWLIRYVVKNINQIYKDIQEAKNREVEFAILREILHPMLVRLPQIRELFDNEIHKYKFEKKKVSVFSTEIEYDWGNHIINYELQDYHYHEVRKRIAKVCFDKGIEPGVYRGGDANQAIRTMQKAIIDDFEAEVSKFSMTELHISLLAYHSTLLHDINVNRQRYGSYDDLDEAKDKEVRERIIRLREKAKHDDRNALYLIETNLFLNRERDRRASGDDICFLIAYANWLVILNDVADMCYFSDREAYIEITGEYVVDTMSENEESDDISGLHFRVYQHTGGIKRDKGIDLKYYEQVKKSFLFDVGFEFELFMEMLSYFSYAFSKDLVRNCAGNVYKATITAIVDDYANLMDGSVSRDTINDILDYLIIDSQKLKTINGKSDFFLPIGNRRNRNIRFEIKPIVKTGEEIIFSPITADLLKRDWINGFFDFLLPYEKGLESTKMVIKEWKSQYEKQIVYDIEQIFVNNDFDIVRHNFELMKLNRAHPQLLGDYDVFAVDNKNKTIWIVECKVIEKVATFYDMYRQQKRFFLEHKEDEKFQRRIDYLRDNSETVLRQLGVQECTGYKVIPYMCMNKVLESRYKKVEFPIVAYSELEEIINNS